jgi:hypothetical protein
VFRLPILDCAGRTALSRAATCLPAAALGTGGSRPQRSCRRTPNQFSESGMHPFPPLYSYCNMYTYCNNYNRSPQAGGASVIRCMLGKMAL